MQADYCWTLRRDVPQAKYFAFAAFFVNKVNMLSVSINCCTADTFHKSFFQISLIIQANK
jgi:hypothetical protein